MKTGLTYGTFDLFHVGHVNLLRRASEMCDRLIVGISTDEYAARFGKKCAFSFEDRMKIVAACRYVDLAIPVRRLRQMREDIRHFNADIFIMGDDWTGEFDYLSEICKVRYLPRTPGISSTRLRKLK